MSLTPKDGSIDNRRYDLDWLRVIAFGLLILYHSGMFYVTWGWHVKSAYAGPLIEPLMSTVNPWRLALLFFISGVAVRFAGDKATSLASFAGSRAFRLGVPIIFGMALIVVPQTYFQLRQSGQIEPGILEFYPRYLSGDPQWGVITPTWNHLWYVVYLFVYILLLTPLMPVLRRLSWGRIGHGLGWIASHPLRLIFLIALPFIAYEYLLSPRFPTTHALVGDWANHAHRATIFLLGYIAAKNPGFWRGIERGWPYALTVAVCLWVFGGLMEAYWPSVEGTIFGNPIALSEPALTVLDAWTVIISLLGLAQKVLNHSSPALRYLNAAVFCYYIVHQTITVSAGYLLTENFALGPVLEPILVVGITIVGCVLSFEIFRRIPALRIAFGIRQR